MDVQKNKLVITQEIDLSGIEDPDIDKIRQEYRNELGDIVRRVKKLKARAEEIKSVLTMLDEKQSEIGRG